jgi:ATP-binding cassette subfamily A (ABC1) protein 1
MHGAGAITSTYLFSFMFKETNNYQALYTVAYGFAPLIVFLLCAFINLDWLQSLTHLFKVISPTFALDWGLFKIFATKQIKDICDQTIGCVSPTSSSMINLSKDGAGGAILSLGLVALFCFICCVLIDAQFFTRLLDKCACRCCGNTADYKRIASSFNSDGEDDDVRAERLRVESSVQSKEENKDMIQVRKISKLYDATVPGVSNAYKVAVKNLSFGVKSGECFGLLGPGGLCCFVFFFFLSIVLAPHAFSPFSFVLLLLFSSLSFSPF